MLKRKAKRIGKKAFKFKFTVVVHNADIHHTEKWYARASRSALYFLFLKSILLYK